MSDERPLNPIPAHIPADVVAYSNRFRAGGTGYPHAVSLAYDRDYARAMADDDETVAATVAAWEREHRGAARDWDAIRREEQDPDDENMPGGPEYRRG